MDILHLALKSDVAKIQLIYLLIFCNYRQNKESAACNPLHLTAWPTHLIWQNYHIVGTVHIMLVHRRLCRRRFYITQLIVNNKDVSPIFVWITCCNNKKHLKNVGPIATASRRTTHCHSPGVATVARRLRIDVHNNDDDDDDNNNDNAWQRGPLFYGPIEWAQ